MPAAAHAEPTPEPPAEPAPEPPAEPAPTAESAPTAEPAPEPSTIAAVAPEPASAPAPSADPVTSAPTTERPWDRPSRPIAQPQLRPNSGPLSNGGPTEPSVDGNGDALPGTCTAPQLRRFIKSRAYVPMHELRRRFAINGSEDDVTQLDVNARRIYIGLPEREGRMLGELLRGGDVGFELSLDPISPIVVGVYPMRPVPRP
ncbi:MAG: hypothetical protein L0221_01300 [Chloroflexi bacterium]|nr:hypothetical protein [Chloroflexota bacterium]